MKDNKIVILAVDSSKRNTGVAIVTHYKDENNQDVFEILAKVHIKVKPIPNEKVFQCELQSYNMMSFFIKDYISIIDYAVLEGYAFGGQGLTKLASTAAVYQLLFAMNNIPIIHIAPKRVKKIIADTGNATKIEVRQGLEKFIKDYSNITWPSYDVSDAAAIGIASAIVHIYPERFPTPIKKPRVKKE